MLMQEHVQNVYGDARILRLRSGQAPAGMTSKGARMTSKRGQKKHS